MRVSRTGSPATVLAAAAVAVALAACTPPPAEEPSGAGTVPAEPTTPSRGPGSPTTDPEPDEPEPDDPEPSPLANPEFDEYDVPSGTRPHDVAPGPDGRVWYTGQRTGELGVLDPATGETRQVPLGAGSAPHGVIVGPDAAPWVTDGGLNAIVRVDPDTLEVTSFPLPRPDAANLNTAAFDGEGVLWFTGQSGVHGRLEPDSGQVEVFDSPRGEGPYGIASTPDGTVWFASLAGSYVARIADRDGSLEVVDVPTPDGGARRVWSDSEGRLWVTEWFAGNLARYDPGSQTWETWRLPGDAPQPYAVYVDEDDLVWISDFGGDALVRFDPTTEQFRVFAWPTPGAEVRQLLGRPGEIWAAGSGTDTVIVLRTR